MIRVIECDTAEEAVTVLAGIDACICEAPATPSSDPPAEPAPGTARLLFDGGEWADVRVPADGANIGWALRMASGLIPTHLKYPVVVVDPGTDRALGPHDPIAAGAIYRAYGLGE